MACIVAKIKNKPLSDAASYGVEGEYRSFLHGAAVTFNDISPILNGGRKIDLRSKLNAMDAVNLKNEL